MKSFLKCTIAMLLMVAGPAITTGPETGRVDWSVLATAHAVDLTTAKPAVLFQNLRASKVYVNSNELPRFGYSNGVVVNSWTQPLKLPPVVGTDETASDLEAHTKSALDALTKQLHDAKVSKEAILTFYIYFDSAGESFDNLVHITSLLNQYMAGRLSYQTNPPSLNDVPIRNVHGVRDVSQHLGLSGNARVAFQVVVLDPSTTTEERIFDTSTKPVRSDGRAPFLIGGMIGQNMSFTVPTNEQPKNLLANLDKILAEMGAQRGDIEQVTIRYTRKSGLTPEYLRKLVTEYFSGRAATVPRINMEQVEVAGFAANETCVEASGSVALASIN